MRKRQALKNNQRPLGLSLSGISQQITPLPVDMQFLAIKMKLYSKSSETGPLIKVIFLTVLTAARSFDLSSLQTLQSL